MSLRGLARGALRVAGVVLMALGVVHLIATPHILLDAMPKKARDFAVGPTLLNHVLVGILLLPLGFSTWLAADARHAGESVGQARPYRQLPGGADAAASRS
jgi:hypothetical protein